MSHRAVAAVIRGASDTVLCVRRRSDASDFPDAIALPTIMLLDGEDPTAALCRLGRDRLGLDLKPARELSSGLFDRTYGKLLMSVWECAREGYPSLVETRQGPVFKGLLWLALDELAVHAMPDTCCALLCTHHGIALRTK